MINFEWNINPMDCIIDDDGMINIIQTVHWRLIGTDENGISSDVYGAQSFPKPSEGGFIPFEELTKEIVVSWLEATLDVPALEKNIEDAIYLINNPVMVQLTIN
ncbi:hypothetical protein [Flavobacterium sp.]|uniref:DUF7936 family protein n=1 Tax=Flavobacterium sp. TaxID=239 RepID=UPI0025D38B10|nr:hypothetical protein [Flavobacterium sp.]